MDFVERKWKQLMTHNDSPEDLKDNLWKEIQKGYSSRKRHYHSLSHVSAMLKSTEIYLEQLEDVVAIQFSIFYHDLIYSITRKDNELKSAEVARQRMAELGISEKQISKTYHQILATQHNAKLDDSDMRYLVDIDLQILGQSPERYDIYVQNIRKEYSIYPTFMYNKGRKNVLASFLDRDRIYHTEEFYEKFEHQARENLQREMTSL